MILFSFSASASSSTNGKKFHRVTLELTIMTQVKPGKEEAAMFNLVDPVAQIESHVGKVVFAKVPSMDLDTLYQDTTGIIQAVKTDLEAFLKENGYDILGVNLNNIVLPKAVQDARDAVYEQTQRQLAATAAGETLRITEVAKATAEKQAKKLQGEGVGDERIAIADAYAISINKLGEALGWDKASETERAQLRFEILALLQKQLEMDTLLKVGTSAGTVLMVPHNLGVTGEIASGQILSSAVAKAA